MKLRNAFVSICLATASVCVSAQKKNIVLHYDFNKESSTKVADRSHSHADATLMNGAKTQNGCLILDTTDAYLDMTKRAGEIISKLSDFTIYVRYYVDASAEITGYGHFLYCFSSLEANRDKEGPYHAYRINEQRCETSIGGYTQETGIQVGKISELGRWITVIFRQKNGYGELYIDGKLIGTESGFPELKKIFAEAPAYNWMGRAPFNGDKYLTKTKIDDFRIYNICISDSQKAKLLK